MPETDAPVPSLSPRRRRPSRVLVLALALAVLGAGASAVAARSFEAQRTRDAAGLAEARRALAAQQAASAAADQTLAASREAASAFDPATVKAAAAAQRTTGFVDQGLDKAQQVDAAGLAGDGDAWNAAMGDANTLGQQETAAASDFEGQFGTLPPP